MTADQHIEETLNRAGGTISDLPKDMTNRDVAGLIERIKAIDLTGNVVEHFCGVNLLFIKAVGAILHLTDVIDRYDEALTRLCDLRDRHVHIVGNVDPPDGVTQEQLHACIEAIIDATEKYRAGLEPWDDWSKNDDDK